MPKSATANVLDILKSDFDDLLSDWLATQGEEGVKRTDLFTDAETREQSASLLRSFWHGVRDGVTDDQFDMRDDAWEEMRTVLTGITTERVRRGADPTEMATFILALKSPFFDRLKERLAGSPDRLVEDIWLISRVIDAFAIHTNEVFIAERERVIERQREEMMELSTPVVELWDRLVALPLIGTLDSARAQEVMENLLEAILERKAEMVIVDITGVQTVDTQVAQHLLRTAAAVRLMGAECIISGISPKIAQTMVQLGVDVGEVSTRSTIRAAIKEALGRIGYRLERVKS